MCMSIRVAQVQDHSAEKVVLACGTEPLFGLCWEHRFLTHLRCPG